MRSRGPSTWVRKAVPQVVLSPLTTLEELKALAELHEQGVLTDEEFAAKKEQLLGLDPKQTTLETVEEGPST